MHVLITRPEEDAASLVSKVEAIGWTSTQASLIRIELNEISQSQIAGGAALIATSRNGIRALGRSAALPDARSLPLYVVGPGSAQLASEMGFRNVIAADGTAADLVAPVATAFASGTGPWLYICGDITAFDLPLALAERNVPVAPLVAYRSVAAKSVPESVVSALEDRSIDAVMLLSPRTAAIWGDIAHRQIATELLADTTHLCLSDAVASSLHKALPGANVKIAAGPNLEQMLSLMKRLAADPKTG